MYVEQNRKSMLVLRTDKMVLEPVPRTDAGGPGNRQNGPENLWNGIEDYLRKEKTGWAEQEKHTGFEDRQNGSEDLRSGSEDCPEDWCRLSRKKKYHASSENSQNGHEDLQNCPEHCPWDWCLSSSTIKSMPVMRNHNMVLKTVLKIKDICCCWAEQQKACLSWRKTKMWFWRFMK